MKISRAKDLKEKTRKISLKIKIKIIKIKLLNIFPPKVFNLIIEKIFNFKHKFLFPRKPIY